MRNLVQLAKKADKDIKTPPSSSEKTGLLEKDGRIAGVKNRQILQRIPR